MNHLWSPWRMTYIQNSKNEEGCVFCHAAAEANDAENLVVARGQNAFVILNLYPYTSGHLMVVPYNHQSALEDLDATTRAEIMELATHSIQVLTLAYHPEGYNLGMNIGTSAGAGIADHVHMHIVPRWAGDTNFMSSLADTRVLPESLEDTYQRIKAKWDLVP